jgi:hypothetical protein
VDIKRALRREGYEADALQGRVLFKELLAVIRSERRRAKPPAIFVEGLNASNCE